MRVNATQAAALLGISEKTVSAWFRSGKVEMVVKVAKPGQPPQWEIELEDLYRALLGRSRRDLVAAEERLALFDRWRAIFRSIGDGDGDPSDEHSGGGGGGNGGYPPPSSRRYRIGARIPAGHLPGTFGSQAEAKQWLLTHGVRSPSTPTSWPGWPPARLDPRDVLSLAKAVCDVTNHRITWRLHECDVPGCVCHQML